MQNQVSGAEKSKIKAAQTFSIITETHPSLTEPNGVFALSHPIKILEVGLINTLSREIELSCLDTDILGCHVGDRVQKRISAEQRAKAKME